MDYTGGWGRLDKGSTPNMLCRIPLRKPIGYDSTTIVVKESGLDIRRKFPARRRLSCSKENRSICGFLCQWITVAKSPYHHQSDQPRSMSTYLGHERRNVSEDQFGKSDGDECANTDHEDARSD